MKWESPVRRDLTMTQSQVRSGYSGWSHCDILKLFTKIRPFLTSIKEILHFPFREGKLTVLRKKQIRLRLSSLKRGLGSARLALCGELCPGLHHTGSWQLTCSWQSGLRGTPSHPVLRFLSHLMAPWWEWPPLFCVAGPPVLWHCEPGRSKGFLPAKRRSRCGEAPKWDPELDRGPLCG